MCTTTHLPCRIPQNASLQVSIDEWDALLSAVISKFEPTLGSRIAQSFVFSQSITCDCNFLLVLKCKLHSEKNKNFNYYHYFINKTEKYNNFFICTYRSQKNFFFLSLICDLTEQIFIHAKCPTSSSCETCMLTCFSFLSVMSCRGRTCLFLVSYTLIDTSFKSGNVF